jgi:hypothetical protein
VGSLRVVSHVASLFHQRAKHSTVGYFLNREPHPESSFEPQLPPLINGDPVPGETACCHQSCPVARRKVRVEIEGQLVKQRAASGCMVYTNFCLI